MSSAYSNGHSERGAESVKSHRVVSVTPDRGRTILHEVIRPRK